MTDKEKRDALVKAENGTYLGLNSIFLLALRKLEREGLCKKAYDLPVEDGFRAQVCYELTTEGRRWLAANRIQSGDRYRGDAFKGIF